LHELLSEALAAQVGANRDRSEQAEALVAFDAGARIVRASSAGNALELTANPASRACRTPA
jgi:hypothetical protein